MHRVYVVALLFLVIGTACRQVPIGNIPSGTSTPIVITSDATETPSPIPTSTNTFIPTQTPTATITPLPTIPTFTPTFDVSRIATVTPASKAECPDKSVNEVAQTLMRALKSVKTPRILDATNDGLPEIILNGESKDGIGQGSIYIYGCENGSYVAIDKITSLVFPSPQLETIQDMNKNGIPEIVTAVRGCAGFGSCWVVSILEWNGTRFQNLEDEQMNADAAPWLDHLDFKDMNRDGTIEIIVSKGLPSHPDSLSDGPWRKYTEIYSWNGKVYVRISRTLAPPQFRFQAVQDADEETIKQNYDEALLLYQDAIFSDKLELWSSERHRYYRNNIWEAIEPTPLPDTAEYPRLSAYAYYRIMLLHIVQGNESDASTVYKTLQQKFSNDPYGQPYVAMATSFWDAYQSTHKMYDSCAAAIQYAAEHPEILTPLGSDYHGMQSHIYVPADVCTFR